MFAGFRPIFTKREYPDFDQLPVFLSNRWIRYIREVVEYQGFIISDDISMKAASHFGSALELTKQSLNVGCDLIIQTHNPDQREAIFSSFS